MVDVRFCDEFEDGFGWIAPDPEFLQRCSHAIRAAGRVWIIDPLDGEGVEERIRALGEPAGVVQLLDRHSRDSLVLATRLGTPHYRTPFAGVPGAPFEVIQVVNVPTWRETAVWFPAERVLVCADALGSASYYLAPGEPLAVHSWLRLLPPRHLVGLDPEHVLVGHGKGVHGPEASRALGDALASARRRAPRWVAAVSKDAARRLWRRVL